MRAAVWATAALAALLPAPAGPAAGHHLSAGTPLRTEVPPGGAPRIAETSGGIQSPKSTAS